MKKLVVLAAVLVAACGGVNLAQAHTLSLAFKTGDTYRYTFHSVTKQTVAMGAITIPIDVDVTGAESVNVKSVNASGVADLSLTMTNLTVKTVTANGVTNTTTVPSETSEVQIANDGRPTSWNGRQIANNNPFLAFSALGGSFFVTAVLPSSKVKPGDTWTKNYDQASPDGTGSMHVTSSSKYLRDESLNGVNAAVVETKSNGTFNVTINAPNLGSPTTTPSALPIAFNGMTIKGTVTTDVTTWIDPNGHRVMKTHSTATDKGTLDIQTTGTQPMPGLTGPISITGSATTDLTPA